MGREGDNGDRVAETGSELHFKSGPVVNQHDRAYVSGLETVLWEIVR
jgi:hypothetical protein